MLARYVNGGFVPEMTFEDLGPTNIIDLHKVSGWAENSVAWAIDNGIMGGSSNGDGTNSLKPRNNTTRAEASKMFTSAIRDVMDR